MNLQNDYNKIINLFKNELFKLNFIFDVLSPLKCKLCGTIIN